MKTRIAYLLTAQGLAKHCQETGQDLYFWTFTTKERLPDWRLSPIWRRFVRDVCNLFRNDEFPLTGVRVLERHKSGYLHYHAIVNRRIPVDMVRSIGARYGIGRVHVAKLNSPKGGLIYAAKYMSKQNRIKGRGCRLKIWGTIGDAFWAVPTSSIKTEHRGTRFLARVRQTVFGGGVVGFKLACQLLNWKWAGFRIFEDFVIWYARENYSKPWEMWFPLIACDEWLQAQVNDVWLNNELDGKVPFGIGPVQHNRGMI